MKTTMHSLTEKSLLLSVLLLFLALPCLSQNIITSNLVWETDQVTDLQNQITTAYKAKFKTNANRSVEWIQRKDQMNTVYEITATEGSWEDVSRQGSITYLLSRNGKSVKMTIEKNATGTFITLDFSVPGEFISQQKFHVQSVQPEN
jgi:hypothetical protein